MAQGKKSFILYADILETVKHLDDVNAGKLFKVILEYVNDKEPVIDDMLLKVVFEPIKQSLKRDLEKWQKNQKQRVAAAAASAEARRKRALNGRSTVVDQTSTVSGIVNVSVSVRVNAFKEKVFSFINNEQTNEANKFIDYWTEISPKGKKMLFEKQKTFDHKRRFNRWLKNSKEWNTTKEKPKMTATEALKQKILGNNE